MFTLIINSCTFTNNNLHENNLLSNSSNVAAVAMSEVDIEIRGTTKFSNNTFTALFVDGASLKFGNDSSTIFQDNSGLHAYMVALFHLSVVHGLVCIQTVV